MALKVEATGGAFTKGDHLEVWKRFPTPEDPEPETTLVTVLSVARTTGMVLVSGFGKKNKTHWLCLSRVKQQVGGLDI